MTARDDARSWIKTRVEALGLAPSLKKSDWTRAHGEAEKIADEFAASDLASVSPRPRDFALNEADRLIEAILSGQS